MPVYEYVCDACGFTFERIQSFNDDPVTECPSCKGTVRRVISPVGVIFKGSGWYITDNRRQISGGSKRKLTDGKDADTTSVSETETKKASDGNGTAEKSESAEKSSGKKKDKEKSKA